ncbi:MAG: hypothetical protein BWY71_01598 [Planctomycetes bacterium ADurb.Bin412]|nr:MAG: hypothetical protein BWY71_01598 [Planctomycetes bacterium ADurb.Bin412]
MSHITLNGPAVSCFGKRQGCEPAYHKCSCMALDYPRVPVIQRCTGNRNRFRPCLPQVLAADYLRLAPRTDMGVAIPGINHNQFPRFRLGDRRPANITVRLDLAFLCHRMPVPIHHYVAARAQIFAWLPADYLRFQYHRRISTGFCFCRFRHSRQ